MTTPTYQSGAPVDVDSLGEILNHNSAHTHAQAHYNEARRIIAEVRNKSDANDADPWITNGLAVAQVHATLANAAAQYANRPLLAG